MIGYFGLVGGGFREDYFMRSGSDETDDDYVGCVVVE